MKKFFNKYVTISIILLLVLLIVFIYLWGIVSTYDNTDSDQHKSGFAIVLGSALWDDEPSPALQERLDVALRLYERGLVKYLVLSGGLGNDRLTEAEGMRNYLVKRGVSENRLILEDKSETTLENLTNSYQLLQQRDVKEVLLVTTDYHMYRAMYIANNIGLAAKPAPVHTQYRGWLLLWKARECLALLKAYIQV